MKIQAAVLYKLNNPLVIEDLQVQKLKKGQVLVKIYYSGVCRSQLMEVDGKRGEDNWLPHLLGHEAVGMVIDLHNSVTKVKKGDEVILGWLKTKGISSCPIFLKNNKNQLVNAGPVTTFSNYSVVSEDRLIIKPKILDYRESILFGCAIPTGAGLVFNQINFKNNNKILIFGLGGIGLSALMALIANNCKDITVVDISPDKLKYAKNMGINKIFNIKDFISNMEDFLNSYDICIESTGNIKNIEFGFNLIKFFGGSLYFVSHPENGKFIKINPHDLIKGKNIYGSWGGNTRPDIDIKKFANKLSINKKINLSSLLSDDYSLEEINNIFKLLRNNRVFRPVIKMKH